VLGIGRIAREHPLAHGICSQLLRVLYLAELNGIDSHAVTEAGRGKWENERERSTMAMLQGAPEYLNSFSCVFKLPLERG
jgi:hypothetical protein